MRKSTNEALATLEPSGIRRFSALAAQTPGCIALALGEPEFDSPTSVREGAKSALDLGQTHYPPNNGTDELRRALSVYMARQGVSYAPDEVIATVGATEALAAAFAALLNPGDEVIIPTPAFGLYQSLVVMNHATPVYLDTAPFAFQLDEEALSACVTPRTKALVITSPNNPTGAVYTRENLEALAMALSQANGAREQPIFLISDEPYREVVYGAEVPWVPSIYEHTVVCYSYSKSLSLPGERVGWILVPNTMPLADQIMPAVAGAARCLGFVCAPALFQRVVTDCVDEPADVEAYARNRETLTRALTEYGYTYVEPDGAFYLWVRALEDDAEAFCERARTFELLPVPSNSFGVPGWIRIGYCVSHETIERSLPAWKALADTYK